MKHREVNDSPKGKKPTVMNAWEGYTGRPGDGGGRAEKGPREGAEGVNGLGD